MDDEEEVEEEDDVDDVEDFDDDLDDVLQDLCFESEWLREEWWCLLYFSTLWVDLPLWWSSEESDDEALDFDLFSLLLVLRDLLLLSGDWEWDFLL